LFSVSLSVPPTERSRPWHQLPHRAHQGRREPRPTSPKYTPFLTLPRVSDIVTSDYEVETCGLDPRSWVLELQSHAFELQSHAFELQSHAFEVQSSAFEVQSHVFELQSRVFEVQSSAFEVQSRTFEVQSRTFEVQSRTFEVQSHVFELQSRVFEVQSHVFELQSRVFEVQSRGIGPFRARLRDRTLMNGVDELARSGEPLAHGSRSSATEGAPS
jgi:cell division protein FtsL